MINPFEGVSTADEMVGEPVQQNADHYEIKMEQIEEEQLPLQFNVIRGEYYRNIMGSYCVVTSLIDGIKCKILDLSSNTEYTVNQSGLTRIDDEIDLQTAQLQYEEYLNQQFESTESESSDNSNHIESESHSSKFEKINPDEVEIGGFYIEGGVSCVIMDIPINNKVIILDLFENKSRRANLNRLRKITDQKMLKDAQIKYDEYMAKKHAILNDTAPKETEFVLTTGITKDPDQRRDKKWKVCHYGTIICCSAPFIFGMGGTIIGSTVAKGSDVFVWISVTLLVISVLTISISLCFLYGNVGSFNVGEHQNKLVFNDILKEILWYKNNKFHDTISYELFKRIGWKYYVSNNDNKDIENVESSWVNVYIVRVDTHIPTRFNGYIADKKNGIKFTESVNSFWAQKKMIKNIENKL
eukprot:108056_1